MNLHSLIVAVALAANMSTGVEAAARDFLDAYGRGEETKVLSMLTEGELSVYGSDAAEAVTGREVFTRMFEDDQKLWGGKASFGPMTHVSSAHAGRLATLFFDTDFLLGGNALPLRVATVWRKEHGGWKLVQSSNVVPTRGQSAGELLKATR
jgi:ketosteroid isomerase-like protein